MFKTATSVGFLLVSILLLSLGAYILSINNSSKSDGDKLKEIKKISTGLTGAGAGGVVLSGLLIYFLRKPSN
jgi:hypothetical protein